MALASLTSDAGGILDLQSVTTKGVQQYGDNAVTLKGTYTTSNAAFRVDKITVLAGDATVSTGTGTIAFDGTVDGGYEFAANSTAATLFSSAVGGSSPLLSLSTNTGGTVSLKSVTTSGFQQYDDNATLNGMYTTSDSNFEVRGTATLAGVTAVATGTGNITFTGAVNGGFSLAADATGDTLFSAAVGGSSALASLKTDAGGTVSLKSVTTAGTQQYGDDATLAGTYATTNKRLHSEWYYDPCDEHDGVHGERHYYVREGGGWAPSRWSRMEPAIRSFSTMWEEARSSPASRQTPAAR